VPWVVARTYPIQERRAAENAERQGHLTYLPVYYDRAKHRPLILFPGYLFIAIEQKFEHLWSTRGIRKLLTTGTGDGYHPAYIAEAYIWNLKAMENEFGHVILEPAPEFEPGQTVQITTGVMTGHIGIYRGMTAHDRCRVLLTLLGGPREVTLVKTAIQAA
jgi:transcription antitermination factor NusG